MARNGRVFLNIGLIDIVLKTFEKLDIHNKYFTLVNLVGIVLVPVDVSTGLEQHFTMVAYKVSSDSFTHVLELW